MSTSELTILQIYRPSFHSPTESEVSVLHSVQLSLGFSHFWCLRIRLLYKKRNKSTCYAPGFQNENVIIA